MGRRVPDLVPAHRLLVRVLVCQPGPAFSVKDVYNGWVGGLRANGVEIIEYPFEDRLWAAQHFHLQHEDKWLPAFPFEAAVQYALEPLGSWIYETQPDLVLFVTGFWIRVAPLELIRQRGTNVAVLFTESPYEDDVQLERAAHLDACVVNDPTNLERFLELCEHTIYLPHSYNPALHAPGPAHDDKRSDLCIVGTGFPSRVRFLERMGLDGLDVALLGNWKTLEDHDLRRYVRGELDACLDNRDTVDWYRSTRASLNLYRRESNRPELSAGWSMGPREVELAATGTFFLTEARGENSQVLPMVPKVADPEDAGEQLRWWLAHDRERAQVVVDARRAIAGWTFENRAAEFLRLVDKIPAR